MNKITYCKICDAEVIITKEEQSHNPYLFCTNCFYDWYDSEASKNLPFEKRDRTRDKIEEKKEKERIWKNKW